MPSENKAPENKFIKFAVVGEKYESIILNTDYIVSVKTFDAKSCLVTVTTIDNELTIGLSEADILTILGGK